MQKNLIVQKCLRTSLWELPKEATHKSVNKPRTIIFQPILSSCWAQNKPPICIQSVDP